VPGVSFVPSAVATVAGTSSIGERRQLAIQTCRRTVCCRAASSREPCLAAASRAGQRQQPVLAEQSRGSRQVARATDNS
jgi:hypothetical protein